MASDVIAEALARIEHKLDLLLKEFKKRGLVLLNLPPVGDPSHICPVCNQSVKYQVDPFKKVVARVCDCTTGLKPVDLSHFAPAPQPGGSYGREGNDESEDRDDAGSGRRSERPRSAPDRKM